jgi:hypothetical protein
MAVVIGHQPMQQIDIRIDTDEFQFDPKAGRFRVISGAGKGGFISRTAVLEQQRRYLDRQKTALTQLGEHLANGGIGIREFQKEAGDTLRRIHVASAILGKGGRDRMSQTDWNTVQETIKRQLYKGRGTDGKPYGIKHLTREWLDGTVSPAQLKARLALYAKSGIVSYSQAEIKDNAQRGMNKARRFLSAAGMHCAECVEYASRGWVNLSDVIAIGVACSCRGNCLCGIEYGK